MIIKEKIKKVYIIFFKSLGNKGKIALDLKGVIIITVLQMIANILNLFYIKITYFNKDSKYVFKRSKALLINLLFSNTALNIWLLFPFFNTLFIETNPLICHLIQSIEFYLIATTRYSFVITSAVISCDQYFKFDFKRNFNNPFDDISTKTLITMIWLLSLIFGLPQAITPDIYYIDFATKSLVCFYDENYFQDLNKSEIFTQIRTILGVTGQSLPTFLITCFTTKILIDFYKKDNEMNANINTNDFERVVNKSYKTIARNVKKSKMKATIRLSFSLLSVLMTALFISLNIQI